MKHDLSKIPSNPGCYIYKNKAGKIIYIGKAKNLKKRVTSYFNKKDHDSKTKILVSKINKIDFIVTESEIEALLLENNLIKKNKPKYNIDLKDSKSFAFIEVTNEKFPRLLIARTRVVKKKKSDSKFYGPFVSGTLRDEVRYVLNKTFKIRTCKRLPKKKCIRYDIGICSAPCINKISKEDYKKDVESTELILKGKNSELLKKLKKKMKDFAKIQNFEEALKLRNQSLAIEYLNEKQNVERVKKYNEDIINYIVKDDKVYLILFNISKGILENKHSFTFGFEEDFLEKFMTQYYEENDIPKRIIVPKKIDEVVNKFLKYKRKSKVKVIVPKIGELKELLLLVKRNVEIHYFGDIEKIEELKKRLNLQELPAVIECFDISHLGGTQVVASMVQFRNGKPDKSNYRKFIIKSFQGNDDFRAMNEVVKRRYKKLKKEGSEFPNLIVIDGGLGQLNSSIKSLEELDVKIPIVSLAKREEEVYVPNRPLPIKMNRKDKARLLLEAIRNEAHRFAVKFQRERRSKNIFKKN